MTKLAALDLGSNSFHLLDAVYQNNSLEFGSRQKEKIQLGAGLDGDQNLSQTAINRGLRCIQNFQRYIEEHEITESIAVATNTLRIAKNRQEFILAAEAILNIPIKVITGEKEAKLIFSAVINEIQQKKSGLVLDIGGGSTEFAFGNKAGVQLAESLEMGCVSYSKRFFADGKIYSENVRAAEKAARLEIEPYLEALNALDKSWVTGTSGTLQSIAQLTEQLFDDPIDTISLESIDKLEQELISTGHVLRLGYDYLDPNRKAILPAGLAIAKAILKSLDIPSIDVCKTALCEGLLLELTKD